MIDRSAEDIAVLVRRLLETEQRLRAMISGSVATATTTMPAAAAVSGYAHPAALACALLDETGVIVHASSGWRRQHARGGLFGTARETRVGANFLDVCDRAADGPSTPAYRLAAGIRSVLAGSVTSFALDNPGNASTTARIDVFGLGVELHERIALTLIDEDDDDAPAIGSASDEASFRATFDQAAVGIAHIAPEGRFIEVNDRFCEITGYGRSDLQQMDIGTLTVAEDRSVDEEARLSMLAGSASTYSAERRFRRKDGGTLWIHLNTTLVRNAEGMPAYFITVAEDVSERKFAEFRLQRLNRLYSVLRRIGEAMVSNETREALFAAACRIAVEVGGLRMVMVAEVDGSNGRVFPVAQFGSGIEYVSRLEISMHGAHGQGTIGTALRSGQHDVCNDIGNDPRMAPWQEGTARWGFQATASFPLKIHGNTIAALVLFAAEVDYFQEDEIDLMVAIANELSFALQSQQEARQREAAQALLRASEASLIEAQRIAHIGSWEWDLPSDQVRASEELRRIYGLAPDAFVDVKVKRALLGAVHPDDRARLEAAIERSIAHAEPFELEHRVPRHDGEERIVQARGRVFRNSEGKVVRLAGTAQDISAQRASDDRIRRSETLLRIAGQTAHIGGWSFDIASSRLTLSDEVCAIRELPPGTVVPIDSALQLYAPEWVETITQAFERCRNQGIPYDLELEIFTASGRRVWVRTMGQPVRNDKGDIVALQGSFQDISERKRNEAEAQKLAARLTTTLENITDAFFTIDSEWRFNYVNRQTERLLQHSRTQLLGANIWQIFPEAVGSVSDLEFHRAIRERCTVEFEHHYPPLNLWAEVRAYPSDDGLAVYFRDITERKLLGQEAALAEQTRTGILRLQQEFGAPQLSRIEALDRLVQGTCALTDAGGCAIELLEGDELIFRVVAGSLSGLEGTRLQRDSSLSGAALASGEVLLCVDAETDPRVDHQIAGKIAARSIIAAPLREANQLVGVLKVISERANAFGPRDVNVLQILAESCSAILQRHRAADALHASEAQYRLLFNSNPHPMWVYDIASLRFLAVNEAAVQQYGYTAAEFLAMDIRNIREPGQVAVLESVLSGADAGGRRMGTWKHRRKDGSVIDVEISSDRILFDGQLARLVLAHDVTERLRAEHEMLRLGRAQRLLGHCIEAQIRADDETGLLNEICRIAVEEGGYRMAWVGYARSDPAQTIAPVACAGDGTAYLDEIVLSWSADSPSGQGPGGRTIRSGRASIANDIGVESAGFHWREQAHRHGFRGVICLPLRDGGHTFGLLGLYTAEEQPIGDEEVDLLQQLADDVAFGIGNLRSQQERRLLQNAVLHVAAGVSASTGTAFFEQLTRSMADALGADAGYVIQLDPVDPGLAHSIMAVDGGEVAPNFDYRIVDTPCADLLQQGQCVVADEVCAHYPGDPMLRDMAVRAYVGRRLDNSRGEPIGLLYVLYRSPLQRSEFVASTLQIFAARAAAEMERLDADQRIREQASLLDRAQDAIVVHAIPDHRILYWNQGAQRLYGWSAEQALGRPMDQLLQIDPEEATTPFQCVMDQGEWSGEFNERRMDGSAVLVAVRCTLVRDPQGVPRSVMSIMSDITERRRAEDRLQLALVELNHRNRELQDFAFVASHDLQEPLRKIRTFADRLLSRSAETLDPQARDYLLRSAQAAERMQTLIDDLLQYSRLDSSGRSFAMVELGPLLRTVIEDLSERIESTSARIVIGPMPSLEGDYTQLRQLFQNLIANALKFRAAQRVPEIRVHAEPTRNESGRTAFIIRIEDNGIGFEPRYAERIFAPFQRLHSRERYEGTGIGLAIVRRIVERHHGSIKASAVSGQGAVFTITLPQRQQASPGEVK